MTPTAGETADAVRRGDLSAVAALVQLVGRPGSEALLLAVARQLERVRPWARTAPSYA